MAGNTHVVVIGGGYAGVMAANRLTRRDDVSVTPIDPRPDFVHRVRPHQLAGGSACPTATLEEEQRLRAVLHAEAPTAAHRAA